MRVERLAPATAERQTGKPDSTPAAFNQGGGKTPSGPPQHGDSRGFIYWVEKNGRKLGKNEWKLPDGVRVKAEFNKEGKLKAYIVAHPNGPGWKIPVSEDGSLGAPEPALLPQEKGLPRGHAARHPGGNDATGQAGHPRGHGGGHGAPNFNTQYLTVTHLLTAIGRDPGHPEKRVEELDREFNRLMDSIKAPLNSSQPFRILTETELARLRQLSDSLRAVGSTLSEKRQAKAAADLNEMAAQIAEVTQ